MHPVRVGTCGWSYSEWSRVFYLKDLPPGEYLTWYAERYAVVEVDSTFYRSPARKRVCALAQHLHPCAGPGRPVNEKVPGELHLLTGPVASSPPRTSVSTRPTA
jgi:hypothetical protein